MEFGEFSGTVKKYSKGEIIYRKGEPNGSVYLLGPGAVRVFVENKFVRGKVGVPEITLYQAQGGDFFGDEDLNQRDSHYASAEALVNCGIVKIPVDTYLTYLRSDPLVAIENLERIATRIRLQDERIAEACFMDARGRVASTILRLSTHENPSVRISQRNLGQFTGNTARTVSVGIKSMEVSGLLRLRRYQHIEVLDRDKLERVSRGLAPSVNT